MLRDLTFVERFWGSRRRPSFIVASLAGLVLSLTPLGSVEAATLTVCASGCDATTIAAAIAGASAGDTITVTDATHTEAVIIVTKDLTIEGQGAASTTVDGDGSGYVFTVPSGVTATIQHMTISNGGTTFGGGIFNNGGTLTISNSTLSGNSATEFDAGGGGIANSSGTLTLTNSTLSGNWASSGGGIANFDTANVKSAIVANSPSGGDCHSTATFTAAGANLDTDGTCAALDSHFTQVTPAALNLGPLAVNAPGATATHALLPGSVAIDAAGDCNDYTGAPVTADQRGIARPQGAACDIGAYEYIHGPDLTGRWLNLTQICRSTRAGQRCWLRGMVEVRNQGDRKAPTSSFLQFYLSEDATFDPATDTFLRQVAIGALRPGMSQRRMLSVPLPPGQNATGKTVFAVIDATNRIVESDKTNNLLVFGPLP